MSSKHKNSKALYYVKNYLRLLLPNVFFQQKLPSKLKSISPESIKEIEKRVDYYNALPKNSQLSKKARSLSSFKLKEGKTYFFDFREFARYFPQELKVNCLFGDITHIPEEPTFVKSRPIHKDNSNSVLLKWNKVRHFIFIQNDKKSFTEKKDQLISRGKVHPTQPQRIRFLEKYKNHPLCNIGKVNQNELNPAWMVERMTIEEQLQYKFILCIEGNDVASNLKWVMSSNSIAVMPKPKFETWFMEGLLEPDVHYIALNDDYSNVEEKLNYFLQHPEKAQQIIENAHRFVDQFKNKQREEIISLLVMRKYFEKTGQL